MYGTLRPGSKNKHAETLMKTARHLGPATINGRLYRVTHYPALGPAQTKEDLVKGDLFEGVTTELLQRLDEYEGSAYSRVLAGVTLEDGTTLPAYFYRYALPTDQLEWIPSGDWSSL